MREPKVFLMDEPLSNLDAKLRVEARAMISRLHHRLETTFIYVTHDQVEAMTMGMRIAVLKDGILQPQLVWAPKVFDIKRLKSVMTSLFEYQGQTLKFSKGTGQKCKSGV